MAALFWDHKHLLLVDFCDDADAVTAAHYYNMLEKIQHAICHSFHGLLQQGMITLTNTRLHASSWTWDWLCCYSWRLWAILPLVPISC